MNVFVQQRVVYSANGS